VGKGIVWIPRRRAMQNTMKESLPVMRREVARRNQEWARAKEEFVALAGKRPIEVDVERLSELDRACDVTLVSRSSANIANLATRA
jgi:hypothetical protein